jgi:hypothetical protein
VLLELLIKVLLAVMALMLIQEIAVAAEVVVLEQ